MTVQGGDDKDLKRLEATKWRCEGFRMVNGKDIKVPRRYIVKLQVQGPNLELTLLSPSNNKNNNKNKTWSSGIKLITV